MERDLHVTSPMMTGLDVIKVQERLHALGYSPGVIDGQYGPSTSVAIRAFQRDHHLHRDGVVGGQTRAALAIATSPAEPGDVQLGANALAEALRHLGVKEQPPESNLTPFGEWFGVNGVPWCNIFVSYCFQVGAGFTLVSELPGGAGVYPGKGCAYVPTTAAWLRATGRWIGKSAPRAGDIVIYNWDGGRPDHIGIVATGLTGDSFEAVEGNTAIGDDSNGGEVMRRRRFLSQVEGFGRVE